MAHLPAAWAGGGRPPCCAASTAARRHCLCPQRRRAPPPRARWCPTLDTVFSTIVSQPCTCRKRKRQTISQREMSVERTEGSPGSGFGGSPRRRRRRRIRPSARSCAVAPCTRINPRVGPPCRLRPLQTYRLRRRPLLLSRSRSCGMHSATGKRPSIRRGRAASATIARFAAMLLDSPQPASPVRWSAGQIHHHSSAG